VVRRPGADGGDVGLHLGLRDVPGVAARERPADLIEVIDAEASVGCRWERLLERASERARDRSLESVCCDALGGGGGVGIAGE